MNGLTKSFLSAFLVIAVAATCFGQQAGRGRPKASTRRRPKPRSQIAVVVPDATTERKVGEASVGYNKVIDRTDAGTLLPLINEDSDMLDMNVGFGNPGTELKRPDHVGFEFTNYDKAKFFKNYSVTFVTEQGSYEMQNVKSEIFKDQVGRRQYISGQLDFETFEKIAESSAVKIKVNKLVFELHPLHMKAFNDLLRTLE